MRTTDFGDDKDRVLIRVQRRADLLRQRHGLLRQQAASAASTGCIYLLGADHHGYVGRLRAMAACAGDDPDRRHRGPDRPDGQDHAGRRGGQALQARRHLVTLEELVELIGVDALRYSLARYPADSPLTLDVDEITRQSSDNPVFYVQYAHARVCSIAAQRGRPGPGARDGRDFDPALLTHEKEGELLRALAEFPRVVASAAQLREPHRVARYLEDTAASYHRFYDTCRVLPLGDEEPTDLHRARLLLVAATRTVLANGLGLLGVSRPGADVTRAMPAHEAGWAHADGALKGPSWLRQPADPNALVPQPVVGDRAQGRRRPRPSAGWPCADLVAEHNTPAYVLDEADFRARARAFRDAFAAYDVFYAGKAFLCTTVAQWIAEEGLCLDVCSGGELTVALRAGFDPARIGYHGNNKSYAELRRAVDAGVGRIIVDSLRRDRAARPRSPRTSSRTRRGDGAGDRRRRGAHPRVHRHRPRGPEVRLLDHQRRRLRGRHAGSAPPTRLELLGLHCHIGSQIFDSSGFEVAARRVLALHARISDELGVTMPELDLGGGFGIAYTTQDDPSDPAQLATEMTKIVEHECRALGIDVAAAVDRARPGDRRPGDVHRLHGRHGQAGDARRRRGAAPTSPSTAG